jgi:hypothetical protein
MRLAVAMLCAFVLGSCTANAVIDESPQVEFIEVPKTKIVHESAPPPEQVEVFPEACQQAVSYAYDIVHASEQLYNSGEAQIDILSDARLYLASGRNTKAIDERQRRLHGKTVANLLELEESYARYELAMEKCDARSN